MELHKISGNESKDTVSGTRTGTLRNMLRESRKIGKSVDVVIAYSGTFAVGRVKLVDFDEVHIDSALGMQRISIDSITGIHDKDVFQKSIEDYITQHSLTSNIADGRKQAIDAYCSGELRILDITLNRRVPDVVKKSGYTEEQIQWCRNNAPIACRDCSDDELWDLLQGSYYAVHSNKNNTISKDIDYKELLRDMPADIVTFSCPIDAGFLMSLEKDGYTEHLLTQSQSKVSIWMHKKEHACGESAPTSSASWTIYEETRDCHYEINIANVGDKYEVEISRLNVTNIRLEMV